MPLLINSPAFCPGKPIPSRYSRDGDNVSPPVEWSDVPDGTRSFALIVEDADVSGGPFRHWVAYNIPEDCRSLAGGAGAARPRLPVRIAINDFGHRQYDGPQPPPGRSEHRYYFRLLALDVPALKLPIRARAAEVVEAAKPHTLAEAEVVGTFKL
jgi:Raf kinase inhibitor-like YbhB/YbcL family protein